MKEELHWKENYVQDMLKICFTHVQGNPNHGKCETLKQVLDEIDIRRKRRIIPYTGKAS